MKKYEKTQAKINKVLLFLLVAAFIYTSFGIEFSDLSWTTNKQTYISLLFYIAMLLALIFEPADWWKRK